MANANDTPSPAPFQFRHNRIALALSETDLVALIELITNEDGVSIQAAISGLLSQAYLQRQIGMLDKLQQDYELFSVRHLALVSMPSDALSN